MAFQGPHSLGNATIPTWMSMLKWGLDPRFVMVESGDWYIVPAGVMHKVVKSRGLTIVDAWDERFCTIDRSNPLAKSNRRAPACVARC
jgi:hypothetical protein